MAGKGILKGSGPGLKCSANSGSVLDLRCTASTTVKRETDWFSPGMEKFVSLVNETGYRIRIEYFQNLTEHLLQKTIITLLVHFKLLDANRYPSGELKPEMKPDLFVTDRSGKSKPFLYDVSLETFYHDLQPIFPHDFDLPYKMFLRPQRYSEQIKTALTYLGEMCSFIKQHVPVLETISNEVSGDVYNSKLLQKEIRGYEVKINSVYSDTAMVAKKSRDIVDELKTKRMEEVLLTNMIMKMQTPDTLGSLNSESQQKSCSKLSEKVKSLLKLKEKLQKSLDPYRQLEELNEELFKLTETLNKLHKENTETDIEKTELNCENLTKGWDDLHSTYRKCLDFFDSQKSREILKNFWEQSGQSRVVHPELPRLPTKLSEEYRPKAKEATKMAKLAKIDEEKKQEKLYLKARIAEANLLSRPLVYLGKSLEHRGGARERIDSEE